MKAQDYIGFKCVLEDLIDVIKPQSSMYLYSCHSQITGYVINQMVEEKYIQKYYIVSEYYTGDWGDGVDVVLDDCVYELTLKGRWAHWLMKHD